MARKIVSETPVSATSDSAPASAPSEEITPMSAALDAATPDANPSVITIRKLGVDVDVSTLPQASISFLLAYGLKQVVSDAAAGLTKSEGPEAATAAMRKKLDSILDGTIGTRAPAAPKVPKGRSLDWFVAAVAKERLVALAQSKGATLPTGDKLKGMVTKLSATQGVIDEATKRYEASKSVDSEVSDDFLAELMEG